MQPSCARKQADCLRSVSGVELPDKPVINVRAGLDLRSPVACFPKPAVCLPADYAVHGRCWPPVRPGRPVFLLAPVAGFAPVIHDWFAVPAFPRHWCNPNALAPVLVNARPNGCSDQTKHGVAGLWFHGRSVANHLPPVPKAGLLRSPEARKHSCERNAARPKIRSAAK